MNHILVKCNFLLKLLSFDEFFLALLRKSWIDANNLSNHNGNNFFHQMLNIFVNCGLILTKLSGS